MATVMVNGGVSVKGFTFAGFCVRPMMRMLRVSRVEVKVGVSVGVKVTVSVWVKVKVRV